MIRSFFPNAEIWSHCLFVTTSPSFLRLSRERHCVTVDELRHVDVRNWRRIVAENLHARVDQGWVTAEPKISGFARDHFLISPLVKFWPPGMKVTRGKGHLFANCSLWETLPCNWEKPIVIFKNTALQLSSQRLFHVQGVAGHPG
jgi:hypothetical protein